TVAKSDVGDVHGVVLPEFALEKGLAEEVGRQLAGCGLEFFIAGVASSTAHGLPRNCAYSRLYSSDGQPYLDWEQAKHHRWKLDRDQIRRYHLGDRLNPEEEWWERICVEKRECRFYVFRAGMTLATLICEDLARIDPVQTVIRAIGPNLVVPLLMD